MDRPDVGAAELGTLAARRGGEGGDDRLRPVDVPVLAAWTAPASVDGSSPGTSAAASSGVSRSDGMPSPFWSARLASSCSSASAEWATKT